MYIVSCFRVDLVLAICSSPLLCINGLKEKKCVSLVRSA